MNVEQVLSVHHHEQRIVSYEEALPVRCIAELVYSIFELQVHTQ